MYFVFSILSILKLRAHFDRRRRQSDKRKDSFNKILLILIFRYKIYYNLPPFPIRSNKLLYIMLLLLLAHYNTYYNIDTLSAFLNNFCSLHSPPPAAYYKYNKLVQLYLKTSTNNFNYLLINATNRRQTAGLPLLPLWYRLYRINQPRSWHFENIYELYFTSAHSQIRTQCPPNLVEPIYNCITPHYSALLGGPQLIKYYKNIPSLPIHHLNIFNL